MATKQLNALNPRNFKEKIELLKKKEAASTANFAAAIRDAREICQIAGAYDPLIKCSLGSNLLDHTSVAKASSLPSFNSSNALGANAKFASTRRYNQQLTVHQNYLPVPNDVSTELHPIPPDLSTKVQQPVTTPRTQVNTNEQLSTLLSSPVHTRTAPAPSHPWHCDPTDSSSFHRSHPPLATGMARPNTLCSRSQTVAAIPNGVTPVSSHMLSQTNPQGLTSCHAGHTINGIRTANSHTALIRTQSTNAANSASFIRTSDYNLPTTTVYNTLQTYHRPHYEGGLSYPMNQYPPIGQPSSHSMYNIPNHTGGWNASPPYCNVQAVPNGTSNMPPTPTTSVYLDLNSTQSGNPLMVRSDSGGSIYPRPVTKNPEPAYAPATPQPGYGTEWRRVSSDSSIRQSVSAFGHCGSMDSYNCQVGPSLPTPASLQQQHPFTLSPNFHNPTMDRKPDTLRRRFPTEPNAATTPMPTPNLVTAQQQHLPTSSTSDVDYPFPAKRAFTGSVAPSANSHSDLGSSRDCSIVASNSVLDNTTNEHTPRLTPLQPVNRNGRAVECISTTTNYGSFSFAEPQASIQHAQRRPSVFSVSAPNVQVDHSGGIPRMVPTTSGRLPNDLASLDTNLSSCDPAELDRFLQLPSAYLDPQSDSSWPGRRDSCTMAAEVLSALNPIDNDDSITTNTLGNKTELSVASGNVPPTIVDYDKVPVATYPNHSNSTNVESTGLRSSSSSFLDVANKLGISITSNDYQLLTDPQLANYVTDETTEAQLLR